jgi:hypothetical protein
MTIHNPVDETNPMALLDENRLLRAENARLRADKEHLLHVVVECLNALILAKQERERRP